MDWTLTLEVDLAEYYVAGYFLSGEVGGGGSARSQQIWAYQGDEKPDKPIEVRNFHHVSKGGQPRYYVWRVTGTKPFHIDFHTLVVNATISGIFIDSVRKSVESAGKLTATWASIKK